MRARAGYVRVSTSGQVGGMSPADQRRLLLARGVAPDLLFDDSGRTASKAGNRPAFDRLLEAVESGRVAEVWMTSTDRLSRNMEEAVDLFAVCRRSGVVICSTDGARLDPADPDHALGLDVNAAVAASYSRQLARKMRRSIAGRVDRGLGVKNRSCFGYCIDRRPGDTYRRQLIRHPEHGAIAREILERFLAGDLLLAQLATWVQQQCQPGQRWAHLGGPKLDPLGAVVMDGRGRPRRHKIIPTTPSTLRAWMEHPELRGAGARDVLAGPGAWAIPEPLLSPLEWGQIQGLLARSSRGRKCPKNNRQPVHPLAGLVQCGHCGRSLHLRTKQRSWGLERRVFQCPNRGCDGHRWRVRHELLHWGAEAVVAHHAQQAAALLQPPPAAEGPSAEQRRQIEALRGALEVAGGDLAEQLRAEVARLELGWRDEQLAAVADRALVEFLGLYLADGWSWRALPLSAPLRRVLYERVGVVVTVKGGEVVALGPGAVPLPELWPVLDAGEWFWPVLSWPTERPEALRGSLDEAEILQRLAELTGEVVEPAEQAEPPPTMVFSDMGELMAARQALRDRKRLG